MKRLVLTLLLFARPLAAQRPEALQAFDTYVAANEARILHQQLPLGTEPLRIVDLTPSGTLPGAMLHHWQGSAFLPRVRAAEFEALLRNFNAYPQRLAPQVLSARAVSQTTPDHLEATLRVRQKHVLTVVLDTAYDVTFTHPNSTQGSNASRSTRIDEIDSPNTPREHPLAPAEAHGFLYRQNTYWTWAEHDHGLTIQIESISLSRAIPTGLAWALRPYLESVPRESLTFTLQSAANALQK